MAEPYQLIFDWPSRQEDKNQGGENSTISESPAGAKSRNVRFINSVEVKVFPRCDRSDIASIWYSHQEYANFKNNALSVIRAVRRHTRRRQNGREDPFPEDSDHCIRGLEHLRSLETVKSQQMMRDAVIHAVLDEQDRQFEKDGNMPCPNALAIASRTNSQCARKIARANGKKDASDAIKFASLSKFHVHREFVDYIGHSHDDKEGFQQLKNSADNSTLPPREPATTVSSCLIQRPANQEKSCSTLLKNASVAIEFNDSFQHARLIQQ